MIKEETFIKCLHPRFILNRYTGKEILVECGKCEHCLMKKSTVRTTLCKLESTQHKYHYFVTLTFSNQHLPLARLVLTNDLTDSYDVVRESDGLVLGNVHFKSHLDKIMLCKKCSTVVNTIPILDYKYCQLFIKRLRKYIKNQSNEEIRFFACGEYGPVHFRPHYHLSLWFDKDETAACIQQAVRACWSLGRVDVSLSTGKSASYVASYVNSNMHLPRVFKFRESAPFSHHSRYLAESFYHDEIQSVQEIEPLRIAKKRISCNGFNADVFLWRSLKTRLFPKCKGYASLDRESLCLSYSSYAIIRDWTQETKVINQARFIADYIKYFDFYHEDSTINDLLQLFRHGLNYYDNDGIYIIPYLSDYDKFEKSIYVQLLLSRRFLKYHCLGDDSRSSVLQAINRIDNYYKTIDYEALKQQLFVQQDSIKHKIKPSYIFHNCLNVTNYMESNVYHRHSSCVKTRFSTFVKHKELNDLNKYFNY